MQQQLSTILISLILHELFKLCIDLTNNAYTCQLYMIQDVCIGFFKSMNYVVIIFFLTKWNDKSLACVNATLLECLDSAEFICSSVVRKTVSCRYLIDFHSLITCMD